MHPKPVTAKDRRKCRQKAAYSTWDAAAEDAQHLVVQLGRFLRPYKCRVCPKFHLRSERPGRRREGGSK